MDALDALDALRRSNLLVRDGSSHVAANIWRSTGTTEMSTTEEEELDTILAAFTLEPVPFENSVYPTEALRQHPCMQPRHFEGKSRPRPAPTEVLKYKNLYETDPKLKRFRWPLSFEGCDSWEFWNLPEGFRHRHP